MTTRLCQYGKLKGVARPDGSSAGKIGVKCADMAGILGPSLASHYSG
jgi:hypothetical protein